MCTCTLYIKHVHAYMYKLDLQHIIHECIMSNVNIHVHVNVYSTCTCTLYIPYSRKIWRRSKFGNLAFWGIGHQIKTRQNLITPKYVWAECLI